VPHRLRVDVLPIQEAVATASPSAWRDAVVVTSEPGLVSVALLDGATWDLVTGAELAPGEPVAVHRVAEVLAVGPTWYSARPTEA
jgi:hypothetical protein